MLLNCVGNSDKENSPKHVQHRNILPTHPQLADYVEMKPTNRESLLYLSIFGKDSFTATWTHIHGHILPITMNFDRDSMWLGKQLTHKIVYEYYLILHRKIIIGFPGQTILWVWVLLKPSLSIVLPAAIKEEMLLCLSMRRVFSCKRLGLLAQGKTHTGERLV